MDGFCPTGSRLIGNNGTGKNGTAKIAQEIKLVQETVKVVQVKTLGGKINLERK